MIYFFRHFEGFVLASSPTYQFAIETFPHTQFLHKKIPASLKSSSVPVSIKQFFEIITLTLTMFFNFTAVRICIHVHVSCFANRY